MTSRSRGGNMTSRDIFVAMLGNAPSEEHGHEDVAMPLGDHNGHRSG